MRKNPAYPVKANEKCVVWPQSRCVEKAGCSAVMSLKLPHGLEFKVDGETKH